MLTMVLVFAAAIAACMVGERLSWALPVAVVLGAWAMTRLPDIDLMLGIGHRSGLTHSVVPAALVALRKRWWALAAGVALGLGLHLAADLFPNAMRGYATVKLPVVKSIGAWPSYVWFAANAAAALLLGAWLLRKVVEPTIALVVLGAIAMLALTYLFTTDGGWWALTMFGGAGWLALGRPQPGKRSNFGS
jgi:hypothetical protein